MRRAEFQEHRGEVIEEIFDRAPYGHIAIIDEGLPRALPLNFVRLGGHLYFHGSPHGLMVKQLGRPVSFTAQDMASWVPSTWRHPHNACPATTFYRSASTNAPLEEVRDLELKAGVLEAFMAKYQPEGGHRGITSSDKAYAGPLEALAVARLSLAESVAKVKVGQNLPEEKRRQVYEGLRRRALLSDRWIALEMRRVDPTLDPAGAGALRWVEDPRQIPLEQLQHLLNGTYWAAERPAHEIARHLAESLLTLAGFENDQLVAYARIASPGRSIAYLFDVVVHPDLRGQGIGTELMRRVLDHPSLVPFARILLDTRDAMPLYRKFGFFEAVRTNRNGGSTLMVGGPGAGHPIAFVPET